MSINDRVEQSKAEIEAAQEVIERRGGFTADEVFKPKGELDQAGEDWSAQRVRGATGSVFTAQGHEFCGMTDAELRARYAVNIPASVTLEGLAAVLTALAPAHAEAYRVGYDTTPIVTALAKAAESVTALLTTEVGDEDVSIGSPSKVMTKEETAALLAEHLRQHQRHAASAMTAFDGLNMALQAVDDAENAGLLASHAAREVRGRIQDLKEKVSK